MFEIRKFGRRANISVLMEEIVPDEQMGAIWLDRLLLSTDATTAVYGFKQMQSDLYLVENLSRLQPKG